MESILKKYRNDIRFNSVKDIFETFLWLHPKLKDEYFVNTTEEKEQEYESNQLHILLVNPCGIFDIMSYREVTEFSRFWSIGTGDEYALGAMYAIYNKLADPRHIAKIGISAACEFNEKSGLPLICHTVKLKNAKR
jgi:ATP-dependent protease HslVU (ClpYQ) peptidase subunit